MPIVACVHHPCTMAARVCLNEHLGGRSRKIGAYQGNQVGTKSRGIRSSRSTLGHKRPRLFPHFCANAYTAANVESANRWIQKMCVSLPTTLSISLRKAQPRRSRSCTHVRKWSARLLSAQKVAFQAVSEKVLLRGEVVDHLGMSFETDLGRPSTRVDQS